jgi:hypothetical protein
MPPGSLTIFGTRPIENVGAEQEYFEKGYIK